MKRSIKKQFSLIFTLVFAGVILVFVCANIFLLKSFFMFAKQRAMVNAYEEIDLAARGYSLKSQDFLLSLRRICERDNLSVIILSEDENTIISYQENDGVLKERLLSYFSDNNRSNARVLKVADNYTVQHVKDSSTGFEYLEVVGRLSKGEYFLLRSSVEAIKGNVYISNMFLLMVGLVGIIAGSITIQIVMGRIVKPILKLTEISEKITMLDFNARYTGKGEDELDQLGQNINKMSDKLETTICELKEANANLMKDIEKKEQQEASQREFIANASHELKTPIALIQGYAEGLKEGIIEDKESRDYYCDVIVDEASKMNILVKSLMSLNELELGQNSVNIERFNISELISNQIQTMSLLAQNQGVTIEYNPEDYYVFSDEFKVEEAFRNYLSNALNHAGGDTPKVVIETVQEKDVLWIKVFNTGEQIPEESIPRLWDKFYKVDKARTREYGGSGVGLSIVKATMELLEQQYGCENKEDGVLFYFTLPMS